VRQSARERGPGHIIYAQDPKELVEKVIEAVKNQQQ